MVVSTHTNDMGSHKIHHLIYRCKRDIEGHLDPLGLLATHDGNHHRTG